jgi:hypothetical protein
MVQWIILRLVLQKPGSGDGRLRLVYVDKYMSGERWSGWGGDDR